tara:strand:- start:293 stop:427 length:135 start_codon:yes stop_codon:yes gene_type:complete
MQHQKNKKRKSKKPKKNNRSEVLGYQPNNPLTLYYKKYIEKQND